MHLSEKQLGRASEASRISQKKWQRAVGVTSVLCLSIGLLGCPKDKPADTSASSGAPTGNAPAKKLRIAVIPKGTAASFWQTVHAGAEAAGKEDGVEIIWQGPSRETDISEQVNLVQNQVSSGVDGIVLAATDAQGLVKPVQDAIAKNVPVVTIDSGLKEPVSLCFIATNNVEGGRKAAESLAQLVGDKGKVGILPFLKGAGSSDDRENGFIEEMKKHPNIQVMPALYTNSDANVALERTTNMLTANPDIVGIFAANEPGGIGAANYLKQRGLVGKVKLVAYDSSPDELKALDDGIIQSLVVQDPFQMGYQGVKTVFKAIKKQPITTKFIDSGVKVVTKENLNTPEVQKLLKP